jgi:CBS-domain-containing membrane protein
VGLPAKQVVPGKDHTSIEKSVKEIMSPLESFSSVSADTSVKNAVYILKSSISTHNLNTGLDYLLVFENKSLIGFVGVPELFAAVQPPNIRDDWYRGWNISSWVEPVLMKGLFAKLCLESSEKPVRDIMSPITSALNTDSSLEEAVFKFYREKRDMLPVVENKKLVGILRASDLFTEMAEIIS